VMTIWMLLPAGMLSAALWAGDWPQVRGPQRNGISKKTGLLKEWPKQGPKLLWQRSDIGEGYGMPAVVGGRLYVMANRGMENEFVQALSTTDGKPIWTSRTSVLKDDVDRVVARSTSERKRD